ncbi:MAG: hypothetical protein KAU14_02065 [Thermoplasmata archaeon]|nr:hypothetical protein [Thermoplasmata archaeon]
MTGLIKIQNTDPLLSDTDGAGGTAGSNGFILYISLANARSYRQVGGG